METIIRKIIAAEYKVAYTIASIVFANTFANMFEKFIFPWTSCELGESDNPTANYWQLRENCWRRRKIFLRTYRWCILSGITAIACMVHLGDAPVYYLHGIFLIWNILKCTTEAMSINKLRKMCHVIWMASRNIKKQSFCCLSVFCEKFS